jgi:hypothetical protein
LTIGQGRDDEANEETDEEVKHFVSPNMVKKAEKNWGGLSGLIIPP